LVLKQFTETIARNGGSQVADCSMHT